MTTIWTEFDFEAVIRRKGHRKTETVIVREQAPFVIPSITEKDAPVALRFTGAVKRPPETNVIRFHDEALYAPLLDRKFLPVKAVGSPIADACTELSETPFCEGFIDRGAKFVTNDTLPLGIKSATNNRASVYAKRQGAAAETLLDIDGNLFLRIPEPTLAVLIDFDTKRVNIRYEAFPGAAERNPATGAAVDRVVVAQVSLDQKDLAVDIARRVGTELSLNVDETPWHGFAHSRSGTTQVVDASYLRSDPYTATLDRTICYLLKASHETLITANDAFVLTWADMRESREALCAGHADAPELAYRAMREFLARAPAQSEFRVKKAHERWQTRTLPVLRASLKSLEILKDFSRSSVPSIGAPVIANEVGESLIR
ncbi:hypothetical protein ACVIGB_000651 [Bradyrhizobium sp. USDA 4341]